MNAISEKLNRIYCITLRASMLILLNSPIKENVMKVNAVNCFVIKDKILRIDV